MIGDIVSYDLYKSLGGILEKEEYDSVKRLSEKDFSFIERPIAPRLGLETLLVPSELKVFFAVAKTKPEYSEKDIYLQTLLLFADDPRLKEFREGLSRAHSVSS